MDYAFFATITGLSLAILLSYDIVCQYHKNLRRRVPAFPPNMQPSDETLRKMRFAIPKKHWVCHGPDHSRFSLNYLRHVGRTYAEGIESGWSSFNPVAGSIREMAPSARQETLDDMFGDWNHTKTIALGMLIFYLRPCSDVYAIQVITSMLVLMRHLSCRRSTCISFRSIRGHFQRLRCTVGRRGFITGILIITQSLTHMRSL